MRPRLLPLASLALLLCACGTDPTPPEPTDVVDDLSSSAAASIAETHNVSYIGTVRPSGISIYMEGTHRLELPDGRFILLSSETVDLNGYVNELAEVTGSVRPTVEEGGTIMRVEQIRLIEGSSAATETSSQETAAIISSESTSFSSPPSVSSQAASSKAPAASSAAPVAASSRSSSAPPPIPPPSDQSAQVTAMAKQDTAAGNWTQAYCAPPTVGFCFPIHRNWYFKSFGSALQALWHVEVGQQSIENAGDGPIAVNLLGGAIASEGVSDGEVRTEGTTVTGYREWTKDRHIEVSAPAALKGAVEYITAHVTPAEEPTP